ncbi:MAG: hypothetical protein IJ532_06065 [Alphaproteobacteria bacterium]|nr:hypothetical protein [Alphaproteobacteria bacterium]
MNKKLLIGSVIGVLIVGILAYRVLNNSAINSQDGELHQITATDNVNNENKAPIVAAVAEKKIEKEKKTAPEVNENIKTNAEKTAEAEVTAKAEVKINEEKFIDFVDMDKWQYNAKDGVYYQTGIVYAKTPRNLKYQKLALFVPQEYMSCQKNSAGLFSCEKNLSGRVNWYKESIAPIFFEISSPDFSATSALTEYKDYSRYTKLGMIYAHIGFRGIESGAPAGIADIKAAIKYLRRNEARLPGNVNSVYVLGIREGGLLAAVLGASGNDRAYMPYLQEMGAVNGIDDNIQGVMLINPMSGLDTANEALEWLLGDDRKNMTDEQKKISDAMAKEYANYVNKAGFMDRNGSALTLQYSKKGIYQEGTYSDYIKNVIAKSLQNFVDKHSFPYAIPKSWEISEDEAIAEDNIKLSGTAQSKEKFLGSLNSKKKWVLDLGMNGLGVSSIKDFNRIFKRKVPPLASSDGIDKEKSENLLFGMGNGDKRHFDFYTARVMKNSAEGKDFSSDLYKQDKMGYITLKRANLYNPLYYLLSSYEGYNTSTVAPYWYIRSGLFQNSDILTSSINLSIALTAYPRVKDVDYRVIWGMGEVDKITDKDFPQIFEWISSKI